MAKKAERRLYPIYCSRLFSILIELMSIAYIKLQNGPKSLSQENFRKLLAVIKCGSIYPIKIYKYKLLHINGKL